MTVVIAGGGLAGASAAVALAQAGISVRLLERSLVPCDKICGEFLSTEAQHYLRRIGLDALALGGHLITRMRVVHGRRVVQADLPFQGVGLSRRVLDEALLGHAARMGVEVRRGETVADLAGIDFLATGKHDLRVERRALGAPPEKLVGFKTYFRLTPGQQEVLFGTVEIVLFDRGYAGLQMTDGGRANLCLLVHRDRLVRAGGTWAALLGDLLQESPHLAVRLADAAPLLDRPLTIARVPYGFMHVPVAGERVFRLGDQACVIPSFSGDGMSMSLHSAALAVRVKLEGGTAAAYHRRFRADVCGPIRRAEMMYRFGRSAPGLLVGGLRLWPGLMRQAAWATRVPKGAVIHQR